MSANTAMNIFAKAVVQRGKIPFEVRGDKPVASEVNDGLKAFCAIRAMAEAGAFPEMSLEEINEEIRAARKER
jgi:antitoxin component of RelBE/YafQ-DinJ toxin-antitoxin module